MAMRLRQDGLTWHVAGDEVVVLDLEGSVYLKVNGTGRLLWERLQEPATEDGLLRLLTERFEVDEATVAPDVSAFLAGLRQRGLLEE